MKRILLGFLLLSIVGCAGPGNFGYVGNGVYRSAQRWYSFDIWEAVKPQTVINLATNPQDKLDQYERKWCEERGIKIIEFDNLGPSYNFAEAYEALISSEKPVIVHCQGGRDRTGGLIAVYKREFLRRTYTDIVEDWPVYGTPGENWLYFLFTRWGHEDYP